MAFIAFGAGAAASLLTFFIAFIAFIAGAGMVKNGKKWLAKFEVSRA